MVSRLVLGCGAVGQRIIEAAAEWPGTLRVITDDDDRVEAFRSDSIHAEVGDPADPDVLWSIGPMDVVLVAAADPERTLAITRTARETFPGATLLAYASTRTNEADREDLAAVADRVLDGGGLLAGSIVDVVASEEALQVRNLRQTLRRVDGTLAVVMHDNPDPDAIASAMALATIAERLGIDAVPCYYGSINHQENRAMVNLLELNLRRLDPDDDLDEFAGFALVDHSRPGVNDQLPADLAVDVVIDHHPPRAPVEADFVDLRSEAGATSTLLTSYLQRFGFDDLGGETVTTALLYGIRVDTRDFSREVSRSDFEAAAALVEHADVSVLDRVESPDVSLDTMDTFGRAIANRQVRGDVLVSCVGLLNDRDALAQAADRLLNLEGITTTMVYGYDEDEGMIYASARGRGTTLDLGETLRSAFEGLGSAGGHADMAGAQLPIESIGTDVSEADPAERIEAVEETLSGLFFDAVQERPHEIPEKVLPAGEAFERRYVPTWEDDADEE